MPEVPQGVIKGIAISWRKISAKLVFDQVFGVQFCLVLIRRRHLSKQIRFHPLNIILHFSFHSFLYCLKLNFRDLFSLQTSLYIALGRQLYSDRTRVHSDSLAFGILDKLVFGLFNGLCEHTWDLVLVLLGMLLYFRLRVLNSHCLYASRLNRFERQKLLCLRWFLVDCESFKTMCWRLWIFRALLLVILKLTQRSTFDPDWLFYLLSSLLLLRICFITFKVTLHLIFY